jgi:hypothetical protein
MLLAWGVHILDSKHAGQRLVFGDSKLLTCYRPQGCEDTGMTHTEALAATLTTYLADPASLIRATRDRIGGSRLAALRVFLHTYSGGACVSCGQATRLDAPSSAPDRAEVGHLIAASVYAPSNVRCGFAPGNLATQCHTCNADANKVSHTFTASEVRAELVPLTWPTLTGRKAEGGDYADRARAMRKW